MRLEFVNEPNASVGAVGCVVSIWTDVEPGVSALPTLSVAKYLTVVGDESVKAPVYVVAVGDVVGSLPSVVYLIESTPASPSVAVSVTEPVLEAQPAQAPPLQWIVVTGA